MKVRVVFNDDKEITFFNVKSICMDFLHIQLESDYECFVGNKDEIFFVEVLENE